MDLILDANFILAPMRYSFNLEHELMRLGFINFVVPKECLFELFNRTESEKLFARKILLSLDPKIVEFKNKKVINEHHYHDLDNTLDWSSNCKSGYCDEVILKVAKEHGFAVGTLDQELIDNLTKNGVPVVTLRSNRLIVL